MAITYKNSKNPCKDRETTKHAKWDKHAMDRGAQFIPFIMNVSGGLGTEALGFINTLGVSAMQHLPHPVLDARRWLAEHKAVTKQRLAADLHTQCTAQWRKRLFAARTSGGTTTTRHSSDLRG